MVKRKPGPRRPPTSNTVLNFDFSDITDLNDKVSNLLENPSLHQNLFKFSLNILNSLCKANSSTLKESNKSCEFKSALLETYNGLYSLIDVSDYKEVFTSFQSYFQTLQANQQLPMYSFMGSLLNKKIYEI